MFDTVEIAEVLGVCVTHTVLIVNEVILTSFLLVRLRTFLNLLYIEV